MPVFRVDAVVAFHDSDPAITADRLRLRLLGSFGRYAAWCPHLVVTEVDQGEPELAPEAEIHQWNQ